MNDFNECAFDEAATVLASRAANEKGITCIETATGRVRWNVPMRIRAFGLLAISPDGARIAVCDGFSQSILLMDTAGGKEIARLEGHAGVPDRACFSPDGKWLVSRGEDTRLILWDGFTGTRRHEFITTAAGNALAFSADSTSFIAAAEHGKFGIFDCLTGRATHGFSIPGNGVAGLRLSASGRHLYTAAILSSGSGDHSSRLSCWEMPRSK